MLSDDSLRVWDAAPVFGEVADWSYMWTCLWMKFWGAKHRANIVRKILFFYCLRNSDCNAKMVNSSNWKDLSLYWKGTQVRVAILVWTNHCLEHNLLFTASDQWFSYLQINRRDMQPSLAGQMKGLVSAIKWGRVITSHRKLWDVITYPCPNIHGLVQERRNSSGLFY